MELAGAVTAIWNLAFVVMGILAQVVIRLRANNKQKGAR